MKSLDIIRGKQIQLSIQTPKYGFQTEYNSNRVFLSSDEFYRQIFNTFKHSLR